MVTALVVAGGVGPLPGPLPPAEVVVAADGGLQAALAAGLRVDLVVGDMDSVDPALLARAAVPVRAHPADKDATDLELALLAVRDLGCDRVVVASGGGGRLDHELANVALLGSSWLEGTAVEARIGPARLTVVRPAATGVIQGEAGSLVSLLPVGGPAVGVRTAGLRWPLGGEDLAPGTTRGVSNELLGTEATVSLRGGVLLAVQP